MQIGIMEMVRLLQNAAKGGFGRIEEDMVSRALEIGWQEPTGSVCRAIPVRIRWFAERRAARSLARKGKATIVGNQCWIPVDLTPPGGCQIVLSTESFHLYRHEKPCSDEDLRFLAIGQKSGDIGAIAFRRNDGAQDPNDAI